MLEADWRGTEALGAGGLGVVAVGAAGAGCLGAGPLVGADGWVAVDLGSTVFRSSFFIACTFRIAWRYPS